MSSGKSSAPESTDQGYVRKKPDGGWKIPLQGIEVDAWFIGLIMTDWSIA
jgi:hypothetical protein